LMIGDHHAEGTQTISSALPTITNETARIS
jgi:hypothetical protein